MRSRGGFAIGLDMTGDHGVAADGPPPRRPVSSPNRTEVHRIGARAHHQVMPDQRGLPFMLVRESLSI